jgi:hypothetical protein
MNYIHLRVYLRSHGDALAWDALPPRLKILFNGPHGSIGIAEFFLADPGHQRNRFVVTQTLGGTLHELLVDAIAIQSSDLAILVRYNGTTTRQPEVTAILIESIERLGLRIFASAKRAPQE